MLKIKIKSLSDQSDFDFDVDSNATIGSLKRMIEDRYNHQSSYQRLIHSGKLLRDDAKLSTFQLTEGEFLVLVVKKPSSVTGGNQQQASKSSVITGGVTGSLPSVSVQPTPLSPASPKEASSSEEDKKTSKEGNQASFEVEGHMENKKRKQEESVEEKTGRQEVKPPQSNQEEVQTNPNKRQHSSNTQFDYKEEEQFREHIGILLENSFMSDMQFVVGRDKQKVPGHSVILGARSKVFQTLLFPERPSQEVKGEEKKILVPDIEPELFRDFLQYIYTGAVVLTEDNCLHLFTAANEFQVNGLKDACVKFASDNLNIWNVLLYLNVAVRYKDNNFTETCFSFLDQNAEQVMQTDSAKSIPKDLFLQILARDSLTTPEIVLFKALLYWSKEKNDNLSAKELAKLIRVPQIPPKDILKIVKPAKLVGDEILFAAMAFHAAPEEYSSNLDKSFQPRGNIH